MTNNFRGNDFFYLPIFIVGIPPEVFVTVAGVNLVYQFWVHTEHIPKLGWYEYVFVSPSNHRIHHAQNKHYVDANYGGVFILWDRIFGTFEPEEESVKYGLVKNVKTFNPIKITFMEWSNILKDIKNSNNIKESLYLFFGPPKTKE